MTAGPKPQAVTPADSDAGGRRRFRHANPLNFAVELR